MTKPDTATEKAIDNALIFIQDWLKYQFMHSNLPGLSVAINHRGTITKQSWGYASLKTKEKLTTKHVFRAASHSKMFTATALALLQEQGKLNFDDKAVKYLPWLEKKKGLESITIRQLLGHVADVKRDGDDPRFWDLTQPFPNAALLRRQTQHASRTAGNKSSIKYSNLGYGLLGQIVEAVSGKSYNRFMKEEVIKPLQLKNTTPEYKHSLRDRLAKGYWEGNILREKTKTCVKTSTEALSPATGLCSTPTDLSKFVRQQVRMKKDIISADAKRELRQVFNGVAQQADQFYGLGRAGIKIGRHKNCRS